MTKRNLEHKIEVAIAQGMARQAAQQSQMQVHKPESGVEVAVNHATADFHASLKVLKHATNDFSKPFDEMSEGMKHFITHQIATINRAGYVLDVLGFAGITNTFVNNSQVSVAYIESVMRTWNAQMGDDAEVKRVYAELQEQAEKEALEAHRRAELIRGVNPANTPAETEVQ